MTNKSIHVFYDERMLLHRRMEVDDIIAAEGSCEDEEVVAVSIVEIPSRLTHAHKGLQDLQQANLGGDLYLPVESYHATKDDILLGHKEDHFSFLQSTTTMTNTELEELNKQNSDLYYCRETFAAACLATGGVIATVEAVTKAPVGHTSRRGMALVRPPGHHACACHASGFCYFNNVAVAAKVSVKRQLAQRVLILDWDIHHGDGTQAITQNDPSILYMSLHRLGKHYFPNAPGKPRVGYPSETGMNGTNVNVGWTKPHMANAEYAAAFSELLLPVIHSWQPDLVLVSSGLDAAKEDILGDCALTRDGYHAMTTSLLTLIGPDTPLVVALEGGYNLQVLEDCTKSIAAALLGAKRQSTGSDTLVFSSALAPEDSSALEQNNFDKNILEVEKPKVCEDRLQAARMVLEPHWDAQKQLKSGALEAINKSILAIRELPRWKHLPWKLLTKQKKLPLKESTRHSLRLSQANIVPNETDLTKLLSDLAIG